MIKKSLTYILCLGAVILLSCNNSKVSDKISLKEQYDNAVKDAMITDSSEISAGLIPVIRENEYLKWETIDGDDYVLVVTFTDSECEYEKGDRIVTAMEYWVTVIPELYERLEDGKYDNDSALSLRASQLVGIPYLGNSTFFIEFWAKPEDMFRPAPDNEITDRTAGLKFPPDVSDNYYEWFINTVKSSFYPDPDQPKYPFTKLGYTFDWGNPDDEFGLSEFVVCEGAEVILCDIKVPADFIKN